MKKQIILGTTVALALTVGAFFAPISGAVSFADKTSATVQNVAAAEQEVAVYQTGCDLTDESETIKTFTQDLVEQGIISQEEADRLVANEQKIEALFSGLTEDLTAEQERALDEKLDAIYQEVAAIYQKIDNAYYQEYYNELAENGVLTAAEIEQLKVADKQIEDLYESLNSEDDWAAIEDKEAQIYQANKAIYDKIDAYYQAQDQQECESESIKTFTQDLVEQGTISQAEAERLVANEQKMEALFSGLTEELTAEQERALDEKLDAIYQEVADIYQKIDNAYYQEYYNELAENGVLTAAEIEQLKVADKQIEDLYESLNSEDDWAAIEDKEAQIYQANKAIYDKIDAYDEAQYQKEMDQMYQEMVDAGEFTAEQVEQLKAVDAQVDKLLEQAGDDLSEEEWAALDQKINALYEGLDFLADVEVYEVTE